VVVLRGDENVACSGNDFSRTAQLIAAGRDITERALASPRRETQRAIQRGRAAVRPALVGAAREVATDGGQSLWSWIELVARRARTSLGCHARQVANVLGVALDPRVLVSNDDSRKVRQQEASG
jgi:hypothetical protein